ncbi:hypothetical protein [Bacillus sp. B25(2016b)]|nr:hypothetical protein [Bacillus sp. B25(2016b)]
MEDDIVGYFKRTSQTCLEHNLRSPEELFAFWKRNCPLEKYGYTSCKLI